MKANIGFLDKFIRIFLGVVMIGMAIAGVFPAPWDWIIGLAGVIPLFTAMINFCPLYPLFGINTKGTDQGDAH